MAHFRKRRKPRLDIVTVDSVHPEPLRWLWPGKFPLAKLSVLSGDPNLGKSMVSLDIAARASAGAAWPDEGESSPAGDVLLLSAEDDVADTIRPRLEAAGADLKRIHVLRGTWDTACEQTGGGRFRRLVSLERDVELISRHVRARRTFRLVVIDPVSAYFDGLDLNSNADVRQVLARLGRLAETSRAAVLLVCHLRKNAGQSPAVYRTLGSVAFTAVARALWTVVKDATDADRRVMVPVKMNLVRHPLGRAYRIVPPGRVEWEPLPVVADADERGEDAYAETDRHDRLTLARRWLREQLKSGPRASTEIKARARMDGVGRNALWQAKKSLGIKAVKRPHPPGWDWVLPYSELYDLVDEDLFDPLAPNLSVSEMAKVLKERDVRRGGAGVR